MGLRFSHSRHLLAENIGEPSEGARSRKRTDPPGIAVGFWRLLPRSTPEGIALSEYLCSLNHLFYFVIDSV
jgi:hypothetical protein